MEEGTTVGRGGDKKAEESNTGERAVTLSNSDALANCISTLFHRRRLGCTYKNKL